MSQGQKYHRPGQGSFQNTWASGSSGNILPALLNCRVWQVLRVIRQQESPPGGRTWRRHLGQLQKISMWATWSCVPGYATERPQPWPVWRGQTQPDTKCPQPMVSGLAWSKVVFEMGFCRMSRSLPARERHPRNEAYRRPQSGPNWPLRLSDLRRSLTLTYFPHLM